MVLANPRYNIWGERTMPQGNLALVVVGNGLCFAGASIPFQVKNVLPVLVSHFKWGLTGVLKPRYPAGVHAIVCAHISTPVVSAPPFVRPYVLIRAHTHCAHYLNTDPKIPWNVWSLSAVQPTQLCRDTRFFFAYARVQKVGQNCVWLYDNVPAVKTLYIHRTYDCMYDFDPTYSCVLTFQHPHLSMPY